MDFASRLRPQPIEAFFLPKIMKFLLLTVRLILLTEMENPARGTPGRFSETYKL